MDKTYTSLDPLLDIEQLKQDFENDASPIKVLKNALKTVHEDQINQFENNRNIVHLVYERSFAIDNILELCWNYHGLDQFNAALIAVGGYGRRELHPYSDVDILILHSGEYALENGETEFAEKLQQFITLVWDIGLDLGQSVRTIEESVNEAVSDLTIISNLIESRFITGHINLFLQLKKEIDPDKIWDTKSFVEAKIAEQTSRHQKFHDTAYNLEPNIKEGPGGLRDIQIIGWVAKRHFKAETLKELVTYKFLTATEYEQLEKGQSFLWKIRFALHTLRKRREDRLLFDYQRELAIQFGYKDADGKLAVEYFMKDYYKNILELERLNEILLQYFNEVILYQDQSAQTEKINRRFLIYKGYIATTNPEVFKYYPFALLEIFLLMAENPNIKGVRASTIRQIRAHRYLIDDTFRKDLRCRTLFMEILRQKTGITHQMRRMNRYGVLAEYIPAFKAIVGQMQHDLYHAYTVDEHTLKVLRNARRIGIEKHAHELPLASKIFATLPKPELIYLASLFHDIGKGRGGDHSTIGAEETEKFCQLHELNHNDTRLVTWLVQNHLIMSTTAQKKDLGDPQVIHSFALRMTDKVHLDYLYILTVSDIRATSPKVWNAWKDSLLIELYNLTLEALGHGLDNPIEQIEKIRRTKDNVKQMMQERHYAERQIEEIWRNLPKDYFLQNNVQDIALHTEMIINHQVATDPLISVRGIEEKGSTEVFIHMPQKSHVFALVTSILAQLALNVTEAKTYRTSSGNLIQIYNILDIRDEVITDRERIDQITDALYKELSIDEEFNQENSFYNLPRTLKQFALATEVDFSEDLENNWTIMNVTASNRPFLLSKIGHVLIQHKVHLVNARISTFGEKVEDVFYISDLNNQMITDFEKLKALKESLVTCLDETN